MPTVTNMTPVEPQFIDHRKYDALRDKWMADIAAIFARSDSASASEWKPVIDHAGGDHPKYHVPIWEKSNLTLEESAAYFGIGVNKLRELTNDKRCDCVIFVGSKRLIKRKKFEKFLETAYSI